MKQTFTFTAPDGTTLKRTSETRTYKNHAGRWVLGSCVGRPEVVAEGLEQWGLIAVEANRGKP